LKSEDIEFVECMHGFDRNKKRATPILRGVIIHSKDQERVESAYQNYLINDKINNIGKTKTMLLTKWKSLLNSIIKLKNYKESLD